MNPPENWRPSKNTQEHVEKVETQSPLYCHGKTVRLSPQQMFWYETNRDNAVKAKKLSVFLSEYASDHYEAFQHQSIGMFSGDLIDEMQTRVGRASFNVFHLPGGN